MFYQKTYPNSIVNHIQKNILNKIYLIYFFGPIYETIHPHVAYIPWHIMYKHFKYRELTNENAINKQQQITYPYQYKRRTEFRKKSIKKNCYRTCLQIFT